MRQRSDDRVGKSAEPGPVGKIGQQDLEFVSAQPADHTAVADHPLEPLGHLTQQRVPGRMTHRVVYRLEPVKIEQEQRAGPCESSWRPDALFQRPLHLHAVGDTGKGIERGKSRDLRLTPLRCRQIIAAPPETVEMAIVIDNRAARQRPPPFLFARADTYRDVVEGAADGQVKAQRSVGFALPAASADKIGQRPADHLLSPESQRSRERGRNIGERAGPVRFPKPAMPCFLIFGEQAMGAAAAHILNVVRKQALPVTPRLEKRRSPHSRKHSDGQKGKVGTMKADHADDRAPAISKAQNSQMSEYARGQKHERGLDHRRRHKAMVTHGRRKAV